MDHHKSSLIECKLENYVCQYTSLGYMHVLLPAGLPNKKYANLVLHGHVRVWWLHAFMYM